VKFIGLSGGIGCGKSTVGGLLADRGAHVIDVDVLSRELQRPEQPLFVRIVDRWGKALIAQDGTLDRGALGRAVFADPAQLAELTAMAADFTEREIVRRALLHDRDDAVVVVEAAMFTRRMYGMGGLVVVDAPVAVAVSRLVGRRGMPEADARARIARQASREERLAGADQVIDNSGGIDQLQPQLDRLWTWIGDLPGATPTLAR
jgi:dephospho-CoA kinase